VLPPMYSPFLMYCVANAPRPYSAAAMSNDFVVIWSKVIRDEWGPLRTHLYVSLLQRNIRAIVAFDACREVFLIRKNTPEC
jgi:hypothetical protein